jgi:TP901 family phage tail tape measure protein
VTEHVVGTIAAILRLRDELSPALRAAAKNFDRAGREMKAAGAALAPMSAAIAGIGVAAIATGTKFDATMGKMVALAGVSGRELEGVRKHILALAPAVGIGPQALADAMMVVSSTTDDTATALKILDVAAVASATGMGEASDVAKALTAVINSYGAENLTAAQAGDILTQTIKDGGAEANELAPVLANVVPIAAQLGVSFVEVGANIATITKTGTPAAEAVTQLSSVFTALLKPTNEGTAALESIGMSYEGLRQSIAEQGLQKTLTELVAKFGDNKTALADVFGRVEALRNVMSAGGQQAATYAKEMDRIKNSTGALTAAHKVIEGTAADTWNKLTADVQVAAIAVGDRLAPAFRSAMEAARPLVGGVSSLIQGFGALPQWLQTTTIGFVGLAAAVGPVVYVLGTLATNVASLIRLYGLAVPLVTALGNSIPVLTARIWLMEAAAAAGVTTLGALASVLAALAIGYTVGTLINDAFTDGMMDQAALAEQERTLGTGGLALEEWTAKIRAAHAATAGMREAAKAAAAAEKAVSDAAGGMFNDAEWDELGKSAADASKELNKIATADSIRAALKHGAVLDKLAEATKLYGKEVKDAALADRIIAIAKAQDEAAKSAEEWAKKSNDMATDLHFWRLGMEQLKQAAVELKNVVKAGPLIPILPPGNQGPDEVLRRFNFAEALTPNLPTDAAGRLAVTTTAAKDQIAVYDDLAAAAAALSDVLGGDLGIALGGVAGAFDGLAAHEEQAARNLRANGDESMTWSQKVVAAAQAASAAMAIYHKNSENLNGRQAALSGAASGAQAGAAFGPWGVAIGAIGGALIGFFSGSGFRAMAKQAGDVLGVEMTAGLAKAIKETMKALSVDVKTAALLNLDQAMAGSSKAASEFSGQMLQLFDIVTQGGSASKAAVEQIGKAFDALVNEHTVAASIAISEMLKKGMSTGVMSNSMVSFIKEAESAMAAGASKILEGLSMIKAPLGDMGTAAAQFFVAGFTAEIAEKGIVQALVDSGGQIEDLYQTLMDEGNTGAAAMLAPFQQLSAAINNEADPSVKGFLTTLQGMGEVLGGLDKMGFVTQDAFQGLETGIQGTRNALDQAGVSGQAMYMALAPQLGQIIAAHEKYGFVIDESTQGLIDEAQAAGIAFPTDPIQQVISLLGQLVVLMGGTLPAEMSKLPPAAEAAFGGAAGAADAAAGDIAGSMEQMAGSVSDTVSSLSPDIETAIGVLQGATTTTLDEMAASVESAMSAASATAVGELDMIAMGIDAIPNSKDISINVNFHRNGLSLNDDGSVDYDGDPTNSFARGSGGIRDFGRGTPAMLHGEEAVLTKDQLNRVIATAAASGGGVSPAGPGEIVLENHIHIDGEELRAWINRKTYGGWIGGDR